MFIKMKIMMNVTREVCITISSNTTSTTAATVLLLLLVVQLSNFSMSRG